MSCATGAKASLVDDISVNTIGWGATLDRLIPYPVNERAGTMTDGQIATPYPRGVYACGPRSPVFMQVSRAMARLFNGVPRHRENRISALCVSKRNSRAHLNVASSCAFSAQIIFNCEHISRSRAAGSGRGRERARRHKYVWEHDGAGFVRDVQGKAQSGAK
jgi:hypothetical protein